MPPPPLGVNASRLLLTAADFAAALRELKTAQGTSLDTLTLTLTLTVALALTLTRAPTLTWNPNPNQA